MPTSLIEPPTQPATHRTRPSRPVRSLRVQIRTDGEAVTFHVSGRLDIYTVPGLRARLVRHDPLEEDITLDLSGITLIDSSGLGTLLAYANQARRGGRRLRLVCREDLVDVLRIARLDDAFELEVV